MFKSYCHDVDANYAFKFPGALLLPLPPVLEVHQVRLVPRPHLLLTLGGRQGEEAP